MKGATFEILCLFTLFRPFILNFVFGKSIERLLERFKYGIELGKRKIFSSILVSYAVKYVILTDALFTFLNFQFVRDDALK